MTRDELIDRLALDVADSMDTETLWAFAVQQLGYEYSQLNNDDLAATVVQLAPHLFDDLMGVPK